MPYSPDVYEQIRRATGEWDGSDLDDEFFDRFLDATSGEVNGAAALVWQEKAAEYAELVDITEAGSSRKNSQMHAAALTMMDKYNTLAAGVVAEVGTYSTTRAIVRP